MRACLKELGSNRTVWVADSFEGMPSPNRPEDEGYDLSDNEYLTVSLEDVQRNFARFGLLDDRVRFLKGWFSQTLKDAPIDRLALLRIDADLWQSTMDVLKAFYGKLSPGGFVIIDDYHSWEPCRRAVMDFRTEQAITSVIEEIDGTGVFWRKAHPTNFVQQ